MLVRFLLSFQAVFYTAFFIICIYAFHDFHSALPAYYEFGQYLAVDSWRYMFFSYGTADFYSAIKEIFISDGNGVFLFSNSFLYFLGWVSNDILGVGYIFVYFVNILFYVHSIFLLKKISFIYGVNFYAALSVFLMNPLVFHALFSLNKEIIGLWIVMLGFCCVLRHAYGRLLFLVLFAVSVKSFFSMFLLAFFVVHRFKIPPLYFLLSLSLFLSVFLNVYDVTFLGGNLESLSQASDTHSQKSYYYMAVAESFMKIPFGYCVSFLMVFSINLLSPLYSIGLSLFYWVSVGGWYSVTLLLSSIMFTSLFAFLVVAANKRGLWEYLTKRGSCDAIFSCVFVFLVMVSMLPVSQHRYLLPIYPILCIAFLMGVGRVRSHIIARL